MTATYPSIFILMLLSVLGSHESQRLTSQALGVSIALPASWNTLILTEMPDALPEFGAYRVLNDRTYPHRDQGLDIFREHCAEATKRAAWLEGEYADRYILEGDQLTPLDQYEGVRLNDHDGFIVVRSTEDDEAEPESAMMYDYYVAEGASCYLVRLVAAQEEFDESQPEFQEIADGLRFFATD